MRTVLVLDTTAVTTALPMRDCIDAVRDALAELARDRYRQFPRFLLEAPETPVKIGLMPAFRAGDTSLWSVKTVTVSPQNRERGLDSHQGAMLVLDGATGELRAVVDATAIPGLRTAATSAAATLALARWDTKEVAILGTGHQARCHIEAMRTILPEARFSIWGRSIASAEALADAMGAKACASAEAAVADADVICTVTASPEPILAPEWIKPGCHINAVGASSPKARELGSAIIAGAELFVDSREQAAVECGEYLLARAEGAIPDTHIRAEIGEVLAGAKRGRSDAKAITVFKSLGLAVEDLAAADRAIRNAQDLGLGECVSW